MLLTLMMFPLVFSRCGTTSSQSCTTLKRVHRFRPGRACLPADVHREHVVVAFHGEGLVHVAARRFHDPGVVDLHAQVSCFCANVKTYQDVNTPELLDGLLDQSLLSRLFLDSASDDKNLLLWNTGLQQSFLGFLKSP